MVQMADLENGGNSRGSMSSLAIAVAELQRLIAEEQLRYDKEVELGAATPTDPSMQRAMLNQVMAILDMDVNVSTYALLIVRYRSVDAAVDYILEPEFGLYRHPYIPY